MNYHISTTIKGSMDEAIDRVKEELMKAGFGVLTEIDIQATLKNKLDVDFKPYRILGACNPNFAYQVLQKEDKVGVFLPCNVVLQDSGNGKIEISAVDPVTNMSVINNPDLEHFGHEVKGLLQQVIKSL